MPEETEGKSKKQALMLAMSLKKKAESKSEGGEVGAGKCYACGGQVSKGMYQGGGVDESYEPDSINDTDGDADDLVYSPEKYGGEGFGAADNDDGGDKNSFLRSYMISRKLRGG